MTVGEQQAQIVNEVGDPNSTIAAVVIAVWPAYSAKAQIDSRLTYLYVKRAALDVRLAEEQLATDVTIDTDISDKESARFAHVQAMRDETQAEIVRIECMARQRRTPAQGALSATEPESPLFPEQPDPNADRYRGSPLHPRSYQRW